MTGNISNDASGLAHMICELSLARDLESIMKIVRKTAKSFTGADGATFVLCEDDNCFYADEEAIEPLWKGQRFPKSSCISGWVMEHKKAVAIRDIYADDRIPHDAYRPTFVKSLLMVPIRSMDPLGAIGVYWAKEHLASPNDKNNLQAIADATAIAIENVRVNSQLEQQIDNLTDERRRLEDIIEGTRVGTWEWNIQTGEIIVNDRWAQILGYNLKELLPVSRSSWEKVIHPDDFELYNKALEGHLSENDKYFECEYRVMHKNGDWIWVLDRGKVLSRSGDSTPLLMYGTRTEISERKQMIEALQKNKAFLQAALDNSHAGIAIADAPDGKLRYVNKAAMDIRGIPANYSVNNITIDNYVESWQIYHFNGNPYQKDEVPLARAIIYSETCSKEFVIKRPDGEKRIVWANAAPILGTSDKVEAGIVVFLDITENKRMSERLRQAEKMEAIGTLAGGIAHDFNNILGGIIGYADLSLDDVEPQSRLAKNIHCILKGGERAKNLVNQILNFSRRGNDEKTPQYLSPLIKEVIELLRASLPSSIIIESNIKKDTCPIWANPTQIHEIVMNLCANAAYAMQNEKGLLEVIHEEKSFTEKITGRAGTVPPGVYSVITIRDNGCGMDTDTLKRVFDPFFTTKTQGEGTGMGMAVLFGIIQSHRGTVRVESTLGKGTTFRVYLPKYKKDVCASCTPEENRPVSQGTGTVLFVDDEELMVKMAEEMLSDLGYTVITFNNSFEALGAFKKTPGMFDLIITDQTMPVYPGVDFAREIRKIKPDIPIILCTGYSKLVDEQSAMDAGIDALIFKPFRKRSIAQLISEVLQKKGES
ncbi:PAS domain-containing protein [Chitinispirillales bacterium ANBcel5]|uniref:PAS domain-containing protein n=1 Tax=Cellulosispirillum alkaliphilum TaxID=3039283 RepID=UPI002A583946|nr:PAS domain-containing protein [Chitinispirillales bacterium ANBcel5]